MKIWITETRNENGDYSRSGDWGVEVPDDWDNKRGNWTDKKPPDDCLNYNVPCDWNGSEWVVSGSAYAEKRAESYPSIGEQLDYIYHNGVDAWKKDVIDPIKEQYPKP